MATVQIYWGDGTQDTINVTYTGGAGTSGMSVASAPNNGETVRVKELRLRVDGQPLATLTVTQEPGRRVVYVSLKSEQADRYIPGDDGNFIYT